MRRSRALLGSACLLAGLASCGAGGGSSSSPAAATPPDPVAAIRPAISQWRIPFPTYRKREMAAYAYRHYGIRDWRLRHPQVIVIHYSDTSTASAVQTPSRPTCPTPSSTRSQTRARTS